MNFRSNLGDDLLAQIIRLSEQERGRSGTPPASAEEIKNLPEVEVTEDLCKRDAKTGELEFPRCAVCFEDLKERATKMPCGHLFDKDCICNWLQQHNQCPVCRHELRTDDQEYEARRN
eukprot:CAMPEP_0202968752 /NCGR_PEP_ID=MMETSP1396-20130829/14182_1 /ASSEMBLY_ACC=CAM_ASM_000872 /TAXON_ID= /ORGANISM="Pseudokeronopsis sp., Strain Brazil" /LENGTH=117 /DNA_ID=CAMNT_0049695427 /DNA_START=690 /DNA_END=1043 /DNA_ORIENTATION=+